MLRRSCFIFCIVISLLFLRCASEVLAQTKPAEPTDAEIRPFSDMTLEIVLPEQTVLALQPIPIVVRQINRTNQPIMGYGGILFGFTPIALYVKKDGSNERVPIGNQSAVSHYAIFGNAPVAPGKIAETQGLIMLGLKRYFPEPGVYEIQAELSNDDGTHRIQSNKVTFEIKMPTGANLAVYNLIKNSSLEDFMFSGIKFNQAEETLETITTMHPNTPYAKYSAFLQGESYFGRKQYSRALLKLMRLENDNNFIHKEKVKKYLKEIRRVLQMEQTNEKESQ